MQASAPKRQRTHASAACTACRKRRVRCEYEPEAASCANCRRRGDECLIRLDEDFRRSVSVGNARQLLSRIEHLQAENDRLRAGSSRDVDFDQFPNDTSDTAVGSGSVCLDRLKVLSSRGEICHYGPTSAFAYLPELKLIRESITYEENADAKDVDQWRTCLPDGVDITLDQHDTLLSLFTRFFASWLYALDMPKFHRDMHSRAGLSKTDYYSPMLHNAILAMSCRFMDNLPPNAVDQFERRARDYFHDEIEHPTISTVNGLMLLASLHTQRCKTNSGLAYFATAVQTAISLGLNVDCTDLVRYKLLSEEQRRLRDATFWSVYCQDRLWGIAVGRQPLMRVHNTPALTYQSVAVEGAPPTPHSPPDLVSRGLQETCKLASIAGIIMDQLYGLDQYPDLPRRCRMIESDLQAWRMQCPVQLRPLNGYSSVPHVIIMDTVAELLSVLALRPLYHSFRERDADQEAIEACDLHAIRIMKNLATYHEQFGLHTGPFLLAHACFGAASIFMMASVKHQSSSMVYEQAPQTYVRRSITQLRDMRHARALQLSEVLQSLSQEWIPVDESGGNDTRDIEDLLEALYGVNPLVF